jgi:hypothetical protein
VPELQVSVAGVVQVVVPAPAHPEGQVSWAGSVHCPPFRLPTVQVGVAEHCPEAVGEPGKPLGQLVVVVAGAWQEVPERV